MPSVPGALSPAQLYARCDTSQFSFSTTETLADLRDVVGQARALEAIQFGVRIRQRGFNLFALGPAGVGKQTIVTQILAQQAGQDPDPLDWVYVNNFSQPHKPTALGLPRGYASRLNGDMVKLVEELRSAIPAAFESDEYRAQVQEVEQAFKEQQEQALEEIRKQAEEKGITLLRTAAGFAFAPLQNGSVMSPAEFEKLPEAEQKRLEQYIEGLQEQLRRVVHQIPQWRSKTRDKVRSLNRETAIAAVGFLIERVRKNYLDQPQVLSYLDGVQQDVVDNVDDFRSDEEQQRVPFLQSLGARATPFHRYEVNLLVDHGDGKGAPVVYEDHPTYSNLLGRTEHLAMMGALVTDFRLIKAGALHRANGGYLLIEIFKVLQHPYAWEGLKRALSSGEIRIQSLEQMLSLVSTVSLEPAAIPLNVKVILLGDRMLYYLLYHLDPEFPELFKVAADFEDSLERVPESAQVYAQLLATLARQHGLRPLTAAAVGRTIEQCSRLADDAQKLTAHMRSVVDLLCEADFWASERAQAAIDLVDIEKTIDSREYRSGRLRELHLEHIRRGTVLIDTGGTRVGSINGLSVTGVGAVEFGVPVRITAVVRLGEGEVIDIEREVELSGPIHSKGVFILSSFLGARYAKDRPLSVSASLVFEQSYGEIEGDSASSTELYALLSALSELPIRQGLAVTGSVNQLGEIQAIGGVNEKIEGFFDVCKAQGLTGDQGVLIPHSNLKHLMLRKDVVDAASAGQFHIYAVRSIDEGIALLTGTDAGERDEDGEFPEGSVNYLVEARLRQLADIRHEFSGHGRGGEDGAESGEGAAQDGEAGDKPADG
jgi:predicted ATP-dependent protease